MENNIAQELASMNILSGIDNKNYEKIINVSNIDSNSTIIRNEDKWWEDVHVMD
jgi:hypothetical protein